MAQACLASCVRERLLLNKRARAQAHAYVCVRCVYIAFNVNNNVT